MVEHSRRARRLFELTGAARLNTFTGYFVGLGYHGLGLFDRAEEELVRALALPPAVAVESTNIDVVRATTRLEQRRFSEASVLAAQAMHAAEVQRDQMTCLQARLVLVEAQLRQGAIEPAESEILAM